MTTPPAMPKSSIIVDGDYITDLDFNNAPLQSEIEGYEDFFPEEELEPYRIRSEYSSTELDFNNAPLQDEVPDYDGFFIEEEREPYRIHLERPSPQHATPSCSLVPNQTMLERHLKVMFGYTEGYVPLRSFGESTDSSTHCINVWALNDENLAQTAYNFAQGANRNQAACYVIPGTVGEKNQAKAADIVQMQCALVDIDHGDTEAKVKHLKHYLNLPTLIVNSGGITPEGYHKKHVYFQFQEAYGGEDLKRIARLRQALAAKIGGDAHFKSLHQPIRLAGSIYHKGDAPRLVTIVEDNAYEHDLTELIEKVEAMPAFSGVQLISTPTPDDIFKGTLDLNCPKAAPIPLNQVLITKFREGFVDELSRFEAQSKAIGHWIRRYHAGDCSYEYAWKEIQGFNEACIIPPWSQQRLTQETQALWDKHIKDHGPPKIKEPSIEDISHIRPLDIKSWIGPAPKRQWIIDQWLPRGYVTALYGDGGVGKSLLAQQLMTAVATGKPLLDLPLIKGRVYGLMCEDDESELWRRQEGINRLYNLKMNDLDAFRLVSRVGDNNLLMTFDGKDTGKLTSFFEALYADILAFKPDLVVLDTAADIFGGNEIYRTHVRQFLQNACGRIARAIQGAVLLCAHPSDAGIQRGTGSGGSTAWNNTVRSRLYLTRPDDKNAPPDCRILSRKKANYAALKGQIYLQWHQGAFITISPPNASDLFSCSLYGAGVDAKTELRFNQIITLIKQEARKGHVYTAASFSRAFEGHGDLGRDRSIREDINALGLRRFIKFFESLEGYPLPNVRLGHGFLCVEGMELLTPNTSDDPVAAKDEPTFIAIVPTHELCPHAGRIAVKTPMLWGQKQPDDLINPESDDDNETDA